MWDIYSWKKSALVRSKILGLFVNTLTAEYTYYADFDATSSDAIIFKTKESDFLDLLTRFIAFTQKVFIFKTNLHEMENILKKKESLLA